MHSFRPSKKVIASFFLIGFLIANFIAQTSGSGQSGGYTNAPNENDCTSCHSGTSLQTSGSNLGNITLDNGFGNNEYIPDSTYSMTLAYTESGKVKFGFEITALDSATGNPVGTFAITNSTTTQKSSYNINGQTRTSVYHKSAGTSASNGAISWPFNWTAPANNIGTVFFYAVINSTNNNGKKSGDVIYAKTFTLRPSTSLPTASISVSNTSICIGDTAYTKGAGKNNPSSWKWTFANGGLNVKPSFSNNQNESFVFGASGTYKIYLQTTNNKGLSLLDSADIIVYPFPTISISSSRGKSLCQGDSTSLVASYQQGAKLLWSTGDTTDKITVKNAGNYSCTATNASGCSKTSSTLTIIMLQKPTISLSAGAQNSLCNNDTFVLKVVPSGLTKYYIFVNGVLSYNSANNLFNLPYSGSTHLSINAMADTLGCRSDSSNNIALTYHIKLAPPNVTCDTNSDSSITFKWQSVTNAVGYEVSEDSGLTWITPSTGATGLTHTVTNLPKNIYLKLLVRAIDNAPCNAGNEGSVVCHTGSCSPVSYITNNYKTSICTGDSSVLHISFAKVGSYALSLDGATPSTQTTYIFKPTQATVYNIDIIDSSQLICPKTSFKIDISVLPALNNVGLQSNSASNTWCSGELAKFSTTANNGYIYNFKINGSTVQQGIQNEYSSAQLKDGDSVVLVATNSSGCSAVSSSVKVTILQSPMVKGIKYTNTNADYIFFDTVNSNSSFMHNWDFGDGKAGTGSQVNHTYTQNGTYRVWMVVNNGKCRDSSTMQVNVKNTGLLGTLSDEQLNIWPNPFTNELNISWSSDTKPVLMELNDVQGYKILSVLQSAICNNSTTTLATESLPSGIYWLKVVMQNGQTVKRIIKF